MLVWSYVYKLWYLKNRTLQELHLSKIENSEEAWGAVGNWWLAGFVAPAKAIPNPMTRIVFIELNELPPRIKDDVASE